MNSGKAKLKLLKYYMHNRGHIFAATEVLVPTGCYADIITYGKNLLPVEIEVKVSKADFLSEIKSITLASDPQKTAVPRKNKCMKHFIYLRDISFWLTEHKRRLDFCVLPARFYFAVPVGLVEFAKQHIKSPYGLISLPEKDESHNGYYVVPTKPYIVKRASYLHKQPLTQKSIMGLARRVVNENISLREK